MEQQKICVGITQGDINGVGYEVLLKAFDNPMLYELCTPVVYGSPKVAAYYRKAQDMSTNFTIVNNASEAADDKLNIVSCMDDEVKVEYGKVDDEAGKAAADALQKAVEEYHDEMIDVLVTLPVGHQKIASDAFPFKSQHAYLEQAVNEGKKSLAIYVNNDFRLASVTENIPLREVPSALTVELLQERIATFHHALTTDFGIDAPRIAVLSLNPRSEEQDKFGTEEEQVIVPVLSELVDRGMLCFGPYAVNEFMASESYLHFDGVLAMYHDQGMAVFNTLSLEDGVIYTAGLPLVRTAPAYTPSYEVSAVGLTDESPFLKAIYLALDIFRQRKCECEARNNPLRKQYYDRRDDSDKLKQMVAETKDEDEL